MFQAFVVENNPKITSIYTAFIQKLESGFHFHGETHDFWELVCVIDGSISVAADERIFQLEKGQAILHNPMQFHNINCFSSIPAEIVVFTFSGENIPAIQNKICKIMDLSEVSALYELAQKYYNFSDISIMEPKIGNNSHLIFIKRLELFLIELANHLLLREQTFSQGALNYSLIVNTVNERIDERLSVSDLARLCKMSEINLQKTFSKYAGVGVIEYFNRIKIHRAEKLLKSGLTVKETALKLGFNDQNYFSTVFKRITGHTPSYIKKLSD